MSLARTLRTVMAGLALAALASSLAVAEPASAPADEAIERIGIDDLIEVTVLRSPGLARARAAAGIARAEERSVRGRDDWQIEVAIDGARSSRARVAGQPTQLAEQARYGGSAAVVRDLPTGGQLRLQTSAAHVEESYLVENLAAPGSPPQESRSTVSQASGRAVLNHSLLRGFGPSIARADRAQAALRTSAAVLRARAGAGELTRDVIRAYWEMTHAALALEVRRSSLVMVRKLHKETDTVVREGGRPKGDLKVAEYTVAVREEAVLRAELDLEEQALALRRLVGLEIGGDRIALWPADLPGIANRSYAVDALVRRGLERNPALAALALDDDEAGVEVGVARDGIKPRLDLTVSAGTTAIGANIDDSFRVLGEGGDLDMTAALNFSLELGANGARGRRDAAELRRRTVRLDREELRREVASSIVLAVRRIRVARQRIDVATRAVGLAKEKLESERTLFGVGRASTHDLFEHQDDLDDARLSRIRAVADHHQAVAELDALTGDILDRYGVEVIE